MLKAIMFRRFSAALVFALVVAYPLLSQLTPLSLGKGAIAVFATPLDEAGNSVKAQKVIEYVARKLNFTKFGRAEVSRSQGTFCGDAIRSKASSLRDRDEP